MLNKIQVAFGMYFKTNMFKFNIGSPASKMEILP